MCRKYYRFGGVTFALCGPAPWTPTPAVELFSVEPAEPEITVTFDFAETLPTPSGAFCFAELDTTYWRNGEVEEQCCNNGDVYTRRVGDRVEILFQRRLKETLTTRVILENIDICNILSEHGALVLHSSHILTQDGESILFSGPCGIGKSTQAELWRVNAAAIVVNGDRTLICLGTPATANGIFYSGTSRICENRSAPLRAIVLLGQSPENDIRRVRGKEAFMTLLSQCNYHSADPRSVAKITEILAALLSAVPVYRLDCRPDASAVHLLREVLSYESAN